MNISRQTFRGLTFDILIEEAQANDVHGGRLWYTAHLYVRIRGQQGLHLVRKSRLPGLADALAAEIRRDGIRVFDRFQPIVRAVSTRFPPMPQGRG